MTFGETLEAIRNLELLIYCLGIEAPTFGQRTDHVPFTWPLPGGLPANNRAVNRRDAIDMNVLKQFADSSGGRAFKLSDSWVGRGTQIENVLTQVADELRSQYTLGYYPSSAEDGRFHSIAVKLRTGHTVRARNGYLANGGH
jgi:VWFA-related protein